MIHEEIVTFEVAKLAKEKGFPQDECGVNIGYYAWDGCRNIHSLVNSFAWYNDEYNHDDLYLAPTQSLLQRWLREEKGIHIGIGTDGGNDWCYITVVIATGHTEYNTNIFPTYEQALEDGLKYALEKLA